MNKFFLVVLSIFLLTACASNQKIEVTTPKYPNWYINPQYEDQNYLYGVGEGKNIEEAIKSALVAISSRLSLNISSSSTVYSKSYRDFREYVTKESTQKIFSNTENLKFNNYEILESKKISFNSFIINLQIKKIDLINSLTNEIKLLDELLQNQEKELLDKDPLTKYIAYKDIFNQYYSKINKIEILKNLNKEFNEKNYFDKLNQIYSKMIKNKNTSTFYISNFTNNELISNKLKEEISKEFKVFEKNEALYEIEISSNINKKSSYGFYIVNNNISFKIYYKNSLIKTKNYITKGASSNSFKDAINNSYEDINLESFLNITYL